MKKFLGLICLIYSCLIVYVIIFDKLKLFLAPNMQMYIKFSLLPLIIMGIILIKEKNDKFKITDLILLLPIFMIILCGDGKLSTTYAQKKTIVKDKVNQKKIIKKDDNEEDEEDINIDKENFEVYFDVIDENYSDLSDYITLPVNDYDKYNNKTIRVRGMAIKNGENIPEGYFKIGKYSITCCAADAELSYFYVKEDENIIKENNWYEIEGVLKKKVYMGINIMYIKIVNIKEIDSSKEEQYVYPCYSYGDGTCKEFMKYNLNK